MTHKKSILLPTLSALLLCLLSVTAAFAQRDTYGDNRDDNSLARFRWEGVVDGTTFVRISRRQVDYEYRSGSPVQRQRYNFSDPLPLQPVDVRLNVIEGRGQVTLLEQPRSENNFTALVRIEDNDRGTGSYAFELLWEKPRNGGWNRGRDTETFEWSGRVDGESIIRVRGGDVRIDHVSGNGVTDSDQRFSQSMPLQPFQAGLVETSGRGEIRLIEQPSRRNDFTTAVRIRDPQGGASRYSFTLAWRAPRQQRPDDRPRPDDPGRGDNQPFGVGLVWSGRVDGTDLLRIRGNQIYLEHQAGVPIIGADYRFSKALPNAPRTVSVRKLKGRGRVTVIEQPNRSNNFTATIRIEDKDRGSSQHEIEVSW